MLTKFQSWLSGARNREDKFILQSHPPVVAAEMPPLVYAIGDVHGCLALMTEIEAKIQEDAGDGYDSAVLLFLGDLVDRGPDSASVLDRLSFANCTGPTRVALFGNHEEMMLQFLENPTAKSSWLVHGGAETLASYGIYPDIKRGWDFSAKQWKFLLAANVPEAHIDFMLKMPRSYQFGPYFASHAGINPDFSLADQTLRDLIWSRPSDKPHEQEVTLVHGHTPVETPIICEQRINVDTGAFATGTLSAVCLAAGQAPRILQVKK